VAGADAAPAAVLDASALMALLHREEGAPAVIEAIEAGAAISVVNWAEVLSKLAERGEDPGTVAAELRRAEDSETVLAIEPLSEEDCVEVARLRPRTRGAGLSLADRACLALAARFEVPALTADRAWTGLDAVGVEVRLIR
jgi:ribonuclease VapC